MKQPQYYRMVDVYAGEMMQRHVNCTFVPDRGFIEPITNRSFQDFRIKVMDWHYSPVSLWIGAKVRHRKRMTDYDIILVGSTPLTGRDGEKMDLSLLDLVYDFKPENVLIQKSTESHSPEWALYKNEEGMIFARPLSEFTDDRFQILYNGA